MCGRYAIYSNKQQIADIFAIKQPFNLETSYNVAPTENVSVICHIKNARTILTMRWGLLPPWVKHPKQTAPLINARVETLADKASFRQAANTRRCLIIANGFYEWKKEPNKRIPFYVSRKDQNPFAMAGIWETWSDINSNISSCCIITAAPINSLSQLHDRMPVIIDARHYDDWLNPDNDWQHVVRLIDNEEFQNDFTYHMVSNKVNQAKYKGADCIEP